LKILRLTTSSKMSNYTEKELSVFKYLFSLQESGITNMFGSSSYIKKTFSDLSLSECDKLLKTWMENYESIQNELNKKI
jgi:hypothetical protein